MTKKNFYFSTVGAFITGLTAFGCIQTMRMEPPHNAAQLPADIFKLHIHVRPEPLTLEIPLLSGKVVTSVNKAPDDPQAEFEVMIGKYEADPKAHASYEERNDYAAALLFAGRFSDAIVVLVQLEKDFPGKYSTASNLGTAYELVGDLINAKAWIKTGMERNPESHEGTEWLHLAILDAKQKLRTDPHWLSTHSVLDEKGNRQNPEIERALEYQLNERLYFIKNNDLVMCDLFYQAAVITADPAKRSYYLRQAPRFGDIREYQIKKFNRS